MAQIPNLVTNPTVPNLLTSLAPKKTGLVVPPGPQSLIPTAGTAGTVSSVPSTTPTNTAGSYKGVPLSGTDAEIQAKMQQIDNPTVTGITPTLPTTSNLGTTPPTTPPVRGLFPDVLSSIRTAGATTEAEQKATAAKIAELRTNLASGIGGIASQPQTLNYGVGRQNQLVTQEAAKESALQGELQSEIAAGTQNIGALQGIAGLTAPQQNFPFVFDPATGKFTTPGVSGGATGGTSGAPTLTYNPQTDANALAQAVIANKVPYSDAVAAMGYAGTTAKALLTSAILAQGGDLTRIQANQSVTQSNIQTAGTTPTNAAAALYTATYPQVIQLQTTTNNIDQFGNLLLSNVQGLNPTILKAGNATIAEVRSQLSSAQQAQFDTTFAQLRAQIANLLSTGGAQIPTQITADANKIIDGTASIGTISATLDRIKAEGNILISNLQKQQNVGGSTIGAPQVGVPTSDYQAYLKAIGQ